MFFGLVDFQRRSIIDHPESLTQQLSSPMAFKSVTTGRDYKNER